MIDITLFLLMQTKPTPKGTPKGTSQNENFVTTHAEFGVKNVNFKVDKN